MWDTEKYKKILNQLKKEGNFHGHAIKSKEDIYYEIAELIHVSYDAAKSWTRPSSTGPRDEEMVRELEKVFGLQPHSLEKKMQEGENKKMTEIVLSDITKNAIFKCYEAMKNYLHDDEMESEDCFCKMYSEVEKYRIMMPTSFFDKISDFIDKNLAPIVYEPEKVYADCYTDEIGYFDKKGTWVIKDEEGTKNMIMNFMVKNVEIEQQLDDFAMKELHPYLV